MQKDTGRFEQIKGGLHFFFPISFFRGETRGIKKKIESALKCPSRFEYKGPSRENARGTTNDDGATTMIQTIHHATRPTDEAMIGIFPIEDSTTVEATFYDELTGTPSRLTLTRPTVDAVQTGSFKNLISGEFSDHGGDDPNYNAASLRKLFDEIVSGAFDGFDALEIMAAINACDDGG